MKIPNHHGENSWVEAVEYKALKDDGTIDEAKKYTRDLQSFKDNFIPTILEAGDEVAKYSMGKLLAVYKIELRDGRKYLKDTFYSVDDTIHGDGAVKVAAAPQVMQFYYLGEREKRVLEMRKKLDRYQITLKEIQHKLVQRNITELTDDKLSEFVKAIEEFDERVSNILK
jgi:tRNA G37 N-methylase TrmD